MSPFAGTVLAIRLTLSGPLKDPAKARAEDNTSSAPKKQVRLRKFEGFIEIISYGQSGNFGNGIGVSSAGSLSSRKWRQRRRSAVPAGAEPPTSHRCAPIGGPAVARRLGG